MTNSDQQLGSENSQVLNRFRSSIRYFDVNFTFLKILKRKSLKVDFIDQNKFINFLVC